mgnify:CR=1 FL=1
MKYLIENLVRDALAALPAELRPAGAGAPTPANVGSRGSAQRGFSAVRWGVAGNIVMAWILTIPASAGMAALAWWLGRWVI